MNMSDEERRMWDRAYADAGMMSAHDYVMLEACERETAFERGLQGFASFCESKVRSGSIPAEDIEMLRDKFRDAAFVVSMFRKVRQNLQSKVDALQQQLEAEREACALIAEAHRSKIDVNGSHWHEGQDWAATRIAEAIRARSNLQQQEHA